MVLPEHSLVQWIFPSLVHWIYPSLVHWICFEQRHEVRQINIAWQVRYLHVRKEGVAVKAGDCL